MFRNNRPNDVRRRHAEANDERGIAMITTLLVMALVSALLVGFTVVVMSDQRYRFIDRDRGQAFYAASGAIEKLTADLGNVFFTNVAPTGGQLTTIANAPPSVSGVTYTASSTPSPLPASSLSAYYCTGAGKTPRTVGTNGYTVSYCADGANNPTPTSTTPIKTGPYEGLIALQTPYQLDVTAHTSTGGDAHLVRTVEGVAIPVFQFGMFSDVDLSFFAGPNFSFGGRVHTNGNLYLAQGGGATLTLSDKVTAVGEIVRQRMQNNVGITVPATHDGTVNMAKAPGVFRALLATEGSVTDGMSPKTLNEPLWHTTSLSTYNSWIRNGRTGAKTLSLPLITVGGTNPDLVRRAVAGEDSSNPILFGERMFSKASLRILLSDTTADLTNLPTVTGTPVQLDGDWFTTPPAGYGPVDVSHPPIARSPGPLSTTAAGGSTTANINVVAVAPFRPVLRLNGTPVTCTAKTATTFTGCTGLPGAVTPVGATLAAGPGVSVVTTVATPAGPAAQTITVASTATFLPLPFWMPRGANPPTLVQCTSWASATQFTGCNAPAAPANGDVLTSAALTSAGAGRIGGWILIQKQDTNGNWSDVTTEILNYGIGGASIDGNCADPTPNAIVRLQRFRDVRSEAVGGGCAYATNTTGAKDATNWWPNVLFDTREGLQRDTDPGNKNVTLGGLMYYVAVDVNNLAKWFMASGTHAASTGANAKKDNGGFTLYFSDRRNNRNASNRETGEYGWEDFVNPLSGTGAPNATLDAGEDVNANSQLDTYGGIPNYNGIYGSIPPGATAPLDGTARPTTTVNRAQALTNPALLFRRALKLINGSNFVAVGVTGLSVFAENPVYVQGDWNATGGSFTGAHAATSVNGDTVTLLSNAWSDAVSFTQPFAPGNRNRGTQTYYRVAIIAGKGASFVQPAGTATDFGTDGGAHNFLRYLENGDQAVNYRGSIATFFYNRQGVGTYKCCTTVYGAPTRNYAFDSDFLTPALLPPNTPVFRDLNAVGFSQEIRPGK